VNAPKGLRKTLRAVALRPELWPVASVTAVRLAPRGWWRRWPPTPWPDSDYWHFRMETAYGGDGDASPDAADVIEFLEWCRESWRRPARALR